SKSSVETCVGISGDRDDGRFEHAKLETENAFPDLLTVEQLIADAHAAEDPPLYVFVQLARSLAEASHAAQHLAIEPHTLDHTDRQLRGVVRRDHRQGIGTG